MKRILLIGNPDLGIAFFKTRTYTEDIKNYVISNREVQVRMGDDIVKIEAANMIRTIEKNKDNVVCCPEQIAYYKGWITKEQLQERAELLKKNSYGEYLRKVIEKTK